MADKQNLKEHKFWGTQPVPQNGSRLSPCSCGRYFKSSSLFLLSPDYFLNFFSWYSDGEISSLEVTAAGPIDPEKDAVKDIRADPLALPAGFEWSTMDIHDAPQVRNTWALYCLLHSH
jgi:hypothetical protein